MPPIIRPEDVSALPANLRQAMLAGCVGARHLSRLAGLAISHGLNTLAAAFCAVAFETEPLNPQTSAVLLRDDFPRNLIPPRLLDTAAKVRRHTRPIADRAAFEALAQARDDDGLLAFLQGENTPANPLCVLHAANVCLHARDYARLDLLGRDWLPPELSGLSARLRGDAALALDQPREAEAFFRIALEALPGPLHRLRLAEALDAQGRTAEGLDLRRAALAETPWHVNLALRLFDDLTGEADRASLPPGRTGILIYSWNKAADLAATLEALEGSAIGEARFFILDNGSTDGTPEVLAAFANRLGAERVRTYRLPVNIGAPAARNWLASLPEVRELDHVAYMDDDILPPPDWLGLLGAALTAHPQAGVAGCRILDMAGPRVIQSAGLNLLDPAFAPGQDAPPFLLTDFHRRDLDIGLYAYCGPCASVMGCCHLFTREGLRAAGEFDIRFSPSQYDDLDHDFRSVLAGHGPVFQGRLAVRHGRRSGTAGLRDLSGYGNDFANRHKLYGKFETQGAGALYAAVLSAQEADFAAKARRLQGLAGI